MAKLSCWSVLVLSSIHLMASAAGDIDNRIPVIGVSIEDFIDVDGPQSSSPREEEATPQSDVSHGKSGHGGFKAGSSVTTSVVGPPPPLVFTDAIKPFAGHVVMTSDDEDVEVSGNGSGSGESDVESTSEHMELSRTSRNTTATTDGGFEVTTPLAGNDNVTEGTNATSDTLDLVIGEGGEVDTADSSETGFTTDSSLPVSRDVYSAVDVWPPVAVTEQTQEHEESSRWSHWLRINNATEVRIRICSASEDTCNGTQAEMRTCYHSNRCDVVSAVVTSEESAKVKDCEQASDPSTDEGDQIIQPAQNHKPLPPGEIDLQHTALAPCSYSLFDLKHGKYVVADWSLPRLVTEAKVKKWCERPGEYLVMHSPHAHCGRYYKDLCHVSKRCKGSKGAPKARGDFAEGCWRQFVYGEQLPVGLSNRQTIVYLICQRLAASSAVGKAYGHKEAFFTTLFDTKGRGPVVSLARLTEMGDTAWPDTTFFIEHGLVDQEEDTAWFLKKARRGIISLEDLGRCHTDHTCELGAYQVLPADYSASTYRTAHLLWPELAGPDPASRVSTFTLTNTAPMHPSLFPAWHKAVLGVRQFGLKKCGLPEVAPADFLSSAHGSAHHPHHHHHVHQQPDHGPALYMAAGVIPSHDPIETIGNDVNVPFMFWMAVCCVDHSNSTTSSASSTRSFENDYYPMYKEEDAKGHKHMSFALYARNTGAGGGVVVAPVLQLEMLLQDIYKRLPSDADVSLFPAANGACSELRHDVSRTMHL